MAVHASIAVVFARAWLAHRGGHRSPRMIQLPGYSGRPASPGSAPSVPAFFGVVYNNAIHPGVGAPGHGKIVQALVDLGRRGPPDWLAPCVPRMAGGGAHRGVGKGISVNRPGGAWLPSISVHGRDSGGVILHRPVQFTLRACGEYLAWGGGVECRGRAGRTGGGAGPALRLDHGLAGPLSHRGGWVGWGAWGWGPSASGRTPGAVVCQASLGCGVGTCSSGLEHCRNEDDCPRRRSSSLEYSTLVAGFWPFGFFPPPGRGWRWRRWC